MVKIFNKIKYLLLILISVQCSIIFAQQNIRFKHITVEDGLSQNAVTCILQDAKGFMWFGTQDGLNRYDGYNFKIFKNSTDDPQSLANNFIYSIYEDISNTLFIETQGGTYQKYDPLTESFSIISIDSIDFSSKKFNSVGAIFRDTSNVIWRGGLSKETGLIKDDLKSGTTVEYKNDPSNPKSLSNNKVYSVYRDKVGNLWVGTFSGLDKLIESTGEFVHYKHDPNNSNSLAGNWVWTIFEGSNGNLWIGTVSGGLSLFNPNTNSFTNYSNDPSVPASLNDNFIFSIYEDRSSNIWIGTNSGGINTFNPSYNSFEHYTNNPSNNNSLSGNNVLSMFIDNLGKCWIGTKNDGLNLYDRTNNKFTRFKHNPNNPNSIVGNSIQLIYEDHLNNLWLGTFSDGLDQYNPATGLFKHFKNNPNDPQSLSDNRVYALFEDKNNDLWIGTYGGGLNQFRRENNTFKHYRHSENDSSSISADNVWAILEDSESTFYVGTFGGGLNIFDREKEIFTHFKHDPSDPETISDNNIVCLLEDTKGNIWIGTTRGLNLFDKERKKFKNYREKDGLSNDIVFGILEDDDANLWISTNKGLSKFNPESESFRNYYLEDGLQSNEFNQNAYTKDLKSGELYFGGINGFNIINPKKIKSNSYIPPIAFTQFIRYNTDDDQGKPINEKGISSLDKIILSHKDNIVTFEFSALSYYNNFMNKYKYKLEGFNKNWIQLRNDHKVTFTNLSPGDYQLRVIGSNNDDVWNNEGATLFITVQPPWWRNKYAYAFYLFFIFGSLYSIRRFEINRREQKSKLREAELSMKAAEAEKRALKIENDRKSQELEEARQLQLSMLPKELPNLSHLDIAVFMRTATEVGGDYYDFNVQDNGVLNVAFGDATGHGLQAGTMVTLMKGFFVSDATKLGVKEFMSHCSKLIKQIRVGRILMCLNILKIDKKKIVLSSAAMPPIYLYSNEKQEIEEIALNGLPLGAMLNFSYDVYENELKSGDIILLLSDGMPEQMNVNEEMFDYHRVKKEFLAVVDAKPKEIIDHLVKSCDNWMGSALQVDDISMVVIKVT